MTDPYFGREQTKAKHFILRRYLQALAFKVLTFSDITYVDGFSGPWEAQTDDFTDSSFMIAISALGDAQRQVFERSGKLRRIRCFFSEANPESYRKLVEAVGQYHDPGSAFEIRTYGGKFEDAVGEIQSFVGNSFPLIFIDPTGWTGYPFDKIKSLFAPRKCEVLINFMYEFVNRFAASDDQNIIASLDPILGGPGWRRKLDPDLPRGPAVEKLFRETLKSAGNFDFVVSTKIDKSTVERPHFFIAYATKSDNGLKVFRQTEYEALREHVKNRANAKERQREYKTRTTDMFSAYEVEAQQATLDEIVDEQKILAASSLPTLLQTTGPLRFSRVVAEYLQTYMLRETNVKDICVDLAKAGVIENTWGGGNRKPRETDIIRIKNTS